MSVMTDNRRKTPRIAYPCLIKFFSEEQGQEIYLTHTENISAGGCYVIVKKEAKKFSHVTVEVDLLDNGEHLIIPGKVAWVEKRPLLKSHKTFYFDVGIEFDHLNEKSRKHLETAIERLIKKGYRPARLTY